MREKRKLISLDTDSALALMQEVYNDIVEQKATASLITKKMLSFMKEAEDMPIIGPTIKDQQKILVDCLAKKLVLVKLQSELMKQVGSGDGGKKPLGQLLLTSEDRDLINKMIEEKGDKLLGEEEEDNNDEKYKI
jgi:hypothetical protein